MRKNIFKCAYIFLLSFLLLIGCTTPSVTKEEKDSNKEDAYRQQEDLSEKSSQDEAEKADRSESTETEGKRTAIQSDHNGNEWAEQPTAGSQNKVAKNINYHTYENERFGFIVQYPDTFTRGPEPTNGDGLVFDNGEAEIRAYGGYDIDEDHLQTLHEMTTDEAPGSVAFEKRGNNWFAISFVDSKDQIIYQKSILKGGVISTVRFTYPAFQKEKYDDLVSHVVDTFVPSSGN